MTNFELLQAIGEMDPDLVERAAQPPRKAHLLRWVAAVAAAAVMVTGVGVWWHTRPEDQPPIDHPIGGTTLFTAPTSLEEAKAAIADGRYEAAYLYLLTDTTDEAAELRDKFIYVPVGATDSRDGKIYTSGSWMYDEAGFPDMETLINDNALGGKKESKKVYTYDEKGRIKTKTIITIRKGTETSREVYTYTYNDTDYLVREDYNRSTGYGRQWTRVYTYDNRGNCVKEEFTGDEGFSSSVKTTTYNDRNQPLVVYTLREGGSWDKQEYTYDADGNQLTAVLSNTKGVWSKTTCTYENGVQTSYEHVADEECWQKWYMDGNKKVFEDYAHGGHNYSKSITEDGRCLYSYFRLGGDVTEDFYEYDQNGNLLYHLCWLGDFGEYTVYTYDDMGNCVKATQYIVTDRHDLEGSATLRAVLDTYVYDADGRLIQQEHRDYNNTVTKTEYTYNADGQLLTKKNNYSTGYWDSVSHTYDENGYKIATEQIKADGRWIKEIFDTAGNVLTKETSEGLRYVYQWELRYYPDGLPADVEEFCNTVEGFEGNDFEDGLIDE